MERAPGTFTHATRAIPWMRAFGVVLIMAIMLSGCVLGEPDAPLADDPIPAPEPPPSALPTTPPPSPDILTASGATGEPVAAGAWRVTLLEAESLGEDRLGVRIELANTSGETLRFTPGDFTLATQAGSRFPSGSEAHDLDAVREIAPGETLSLSGIFDDGAVEGGEVTLVFVPAEGGPVRIEIEVTLS